MKTNTHKTLIQ